MIGTDDDHPEGPPQGDAGTPAALDEDWLRRSAFHYLERYASSEANLARVLRRRIARRYRGVDLISADLETAIGNVLAFCREYGLVDDRAFAEMKVAAGRRKGLSERKLAGTLAGKGIDRDLAAEALGRSDLDDRSAAILYARRRRLGPWRTQQGEDRERKDIAALCRAGYSYAIARGVVTMSIDEAEESLQAGEAGH